MSNFSGSTGENILKRY